MPQQRFPARLAATLVSVAGLAFVPAPPAVAATGPTAVTTLDLPRESPTGKVSQQVGLTEIAVEYGSPAVKGRKIWGAAVPYDKLWSLGAYQATKIRHQIQLGIYAGSIQFQRIGKVPAHR